MIALLVGCGFFAGDPERPPAALAFAENSDRGVLLHVHGQPPMDDALPQPPEGGRLIGLEVRTADGHLVDIQSTEVALEGLTVVLGPVEPGRLGLIGHYEFPMGPTVPLPSLVVLHERRARPNERPLPGQ